MYEASDQDLISAELFNALWDWARDYMKGQPEDWADPWNIDWADFNARGMRLARKLKMELGGSTGVQYVRAAEDPDKDRLLLSLL